MPTARIPWYAKSFVAVSKSDQPADPGPGVHGLASDGPWMRMS